MRRKSSATNTPAASAFLAQQIAGVGGGGKSRHESSVAGYANVGASQSNLHQHQLLSKEFKEPSSSSVDQAWYANLKADMVRAYSDYLTRKDKMSGNYKLVLLTTAAPGDVLLPSMPAPHLGLHYRLLVKVVEGRGGVIAVEVFCRDDFLHVRLSVVEGGRLPSPSPGGHYYLVQGKATARPVVECLDLMRDYTHVHSFSHDYHLRVIYDYVEGLKQTPLLQQHQHHHSNCYDIVGFLSAMTRAIRQPPLYANHYVYVTQFEASSRNIGREKIFKYMQANQSRYRVRVMRIQRESSAEYCLVELGGRVGDKHHVLYVISQDKASKQNDCVNFNVFIVLLDLDARFPIQRLPRPTTASLSGGSAAASVAAAAAAVSSRGPATSGGGGGRIRTSSASAAVTPPRRISSGEGA